MYNRYGERIREGIGWIGDLESGNGSMGSLQGPEDSSGNTEPDYHPGIGNAPADGKVASMSNDSSTDTATADAFAWLEDELLAGIQELQFH
ncbi:hypothetical protein H8B09_19395 [Paenibacillus sp. PR3]|uniref:Uncharacterized protein n=1 Tax=Paenibacillus terricola TaxID=2763503 RepID=A0ABR8N167_9BACL|nr:hypothetical protein [Paenibacillus terricola]MBD3920940.1 hypothetical protein [Paenibacillus terricola]